MVSKLDCARILLGPCPCQHLVLSVLFYLGHSAAIECHLLWLSSAFAIMNETADFFTGFVSFHTSSLVKSLFKSFVHFKFSYLGALGCLSQLSIRLLISAQVMVMGLLDQTPCWAPCWVWVPVKILPLPSTSEKTIKEEFGFLL